MSSSDIPTIRYQSLIQSLIQPLKSLPNFRATATCILMRDGSTICLSSVPKVTQALLSSGFFRGDLLLDDQCYRQNRVIFSQAYAEQDLVQKGIHQICTAHGLYRCYAITRNCPDCSLISTYNTINPQRNDQEIYDQTIDVFENTLVQFLDATIDIYAQEIPGLRKSRFATDTTYRHHIIKDRISAKKMVTNLTDSEIEVLYWTSRGKTAKDIAMILQLSINTISTYRQRAIQKMDAANITHATHLASSQGLIP